MKKQGKRLSVMLALALVLSALVLPAAAVEANQTAVDTVLQYSGAVSIQYALIDGDEIALSGNAGVYSKTENAALTAENIYGIGSVSKTYTAVMVMKLVEEGKVLLDAPVTTYIPEFKMEDERYTQITVRMLLNHSSGLFGSSTGSGFSFDDTSDTAKAALLSRLETQHLKAAPGAFSVYCNDGFTLAEILIERVSGKSYTQYLHEVITEPLGLENTFTPQDSFDVSQLTKTYYGEELTALPQETLSIIGTGGIYSSAEDMARFGSMFYNGKLLSKQSTDAMTAPEYIGSNGVWPEDEDQSVSYGLGLDNVEIFPFEASGIRAIAKGGDTLNYHAALVVLPEHNMAAAVVSSGGSSTFNQLLAERLLIDALAEKGIAVDETVPALPEVSPAEVPESERTKAGYYAALGTGFNVAISEEGRMSMEGMPDMELTYMDDGSWRDAEGLYLFKLVQEDDGNVYFYQKSYTAIPSLPPLVTSVYGAQLMPVNEVEDATWEAWEQYGDDLFFMAGEPYFSQIYLMQPFMSLSVVRNDSGYVNGSTVLDETTILPEHQVPGVGSRDYQVIEVAEKDNATYLHINDYVMVYQGDVQDVFAGQGAICTIQSNGYARWYTIGAAAGRQMTVQSPNGSNFYVYNAEGVVTASSIFGNTGGVLPEGGYLVFAGETGGRFLISIS